MYSIRSASTALFLLAILTPLRAVGPYLTANAPDAARLLPAPPVLGSNEDKIDRNAAYAVYSTRTTEDAARGRGENTLTIFHFADVLGAWWQPGKFPKAEALFKQVEAETKTITNAGKARWNRPRPYAAEASRFADPIEREEKPSASYPSGHSTRGTLLSLLLAEIFPEKREALAERGRSIGWVRVQGGVHTPLDIYAGRVLGQSLAQAFLGNPAFERDFAEAKAELVAATAELVH